VVKDSFRNIKPLRRYWSFTFEIRKLHFCANLPLKAFYKVGRGSLYLLSYVEVKAHIFTSARPFYNTLVYKRLMSSDIPVSRNNFFSNMYKSRSSYEKEQLGLTTQKIVSGSNILLQRSFKAIILDNAMYLNKLGS